MSENDNSNDSSHYINSSSQKSETGKNRTINNTLSELSGQFHEPLLKSSIRMLIIISLSHNKKLSFSDLLKLTSTGKGSLSNHLSKLEENGLIRVFNVFSVSGPRVMVEITIQGKEVYEKLSTLLKSVFSD
ncbi:MAG: transcriptional regulator [Thermoplasmataceae archaeon]